MLMDMQSGRFVFGWVPTSLASPAMIPEAARATPAGRPQRARNPANGFRNLPEPSGVYPFHLDVREVLGSDGVAEMEAAAKLVFHAVGDTGGGGGQGSVAQEAIAHHLAKQCQGGAPPDRPRFFYILGDVIYFNGEREHYEEQFYEPYKNYPGPVFAIAGNHDGAVHRGDTPLQGFMENFCSPQPHNSGLAGESPRTTMTQPNCYWTLRTPLCRVIGLYSNVPGLLDRQTPRQRDWLTEELRRSAGERCVIVTVHHPPYSRDTSHGGYEAIGETLDFAFREAGRVPHLVMCGHVHNYQRFERDMRGFGVNRSLPYVIAGAGGYAGFDTLHQVDPDEPLPAGLTAAAYEDTLPGFLRISVTRTEILGEYFAVPRPPEHFQGPVAKRDEFRVALDG
jgi:Calcineurin-like phosphoesterase